MNHRPIALVRLCEMEHGQEGDLFALLAAKQELTTRDGKPYHRVTFRDARREVTFPIWADSAWAGVCRDEWSTGAYFKLRAAYCDTKYGPQLEIRKIREVVPADTADGFNTADFLPQSRYDPQQMFDELCALARQQIGGEPLRSLVLDLLHENHQALLTLPAARRNHHHFAGGWLEHVLSVARSCVWLAEKYIEQYPEMQPPLSKDLVVAGGVLHDIGKLRELEWQAEGPVYTPAGDLIGHVLQGRDMVREAAAGRNWPGDELLRLEHIIVSHQRLPEWGAPKPPMTPEALLVHYADDLDAKLQMMVDALRDDQHEGHMTSRRNALMQPVYRGTPAS